MKRINLAPTQSLSGWIVANLDGLAVGAAVAAGIVGLMLVIRAVGRRIHAKDPMCHSWRGVLGSMLSKTSLLFMIVAAADIVASYTDIPARLERGFGIAFTIVAAFQAAIWARELVVGIIRSRVGDDPGATTLGNAIGIVRVLVSVAAFAIAIIVILDNVGVNVTALVAGLGVGGIAIGLAAQGIFSDLFAALSIVFDRPFRRGDIIRFDESTGRVERIGLKTTRIRALSGEQIIMANTKLLDREIRNLEDGLSRRVTIPFGLAYATGPDLLARVEVIARDAVGGCKSCTFIRCVMIGFGEWSINHELVLDNRTIDADQLAADRAAIMLRLIQGFSAQGIAIASPTQIGFVGDPAGTLIMPNSGAPPPPRG